MRRSGKNNKKDKSALDRDYREALDSGHGGHSATIGNGKSILPPYIQGTYDMARFPE